MPARFLLANLLILFFTCQKGFSETTNPLPESVKAIAATYNQTLLGKNTFVFDPSMDMKEVQTLIDSLHAGKVFPTK